MTTRDKLYIVDGSGYIYRAFFAIRPLSTRTGIPTNAVLGVARMLQKLIKDEKPTLLGVAFDPPTKNFRHQIYTEYKATREKPPEDLIPQFALIHELVDKMGLPRLVRDGFEADDVIATLTREAVEQGRDVVVVTGDKDLMQLVAPHVAMYDPMKDKRYSREDVIEKFGVPPERVVDVLALCGDTSDNIPGVPKVGQKTAAKLVSDYGDVEAIIASLQEPGKKLKAAEQSVLDNIESARLSKQLATLNDHAPIALDLELLRYKPPVEEVFAPFLRKIEAVALIREFGFGTSDAGATPSNVALATPSAPTDVAVTTKPTDVTDAPKPAATQRPLLAAFDKDPIDRAPYQTVLTQEALTQIVAAARARKLVCVDLETTSLDPNRADIVGIALAVPGTPPVYIPIAHRYLGAPKQLPRADVLKALEPLLTDPEIKKLGQNIKYDMITLARAGIVVQGVHDDTMLLAWVLDTTRASYALDALAREVLGHENIRYEDVAGKGQKQKNFEEVPVEQATPYAAEDADVALHMHQGLTPKLEAVPELLKLYRELEMPLVPLLAKIERTGIRVDGTKLTGLGKEFDGRLQKLEEQAYALVGHRINLASPKQLGELFFEKLGFEVVRKTKTGYSTDSDVLEELAEKHELPRIILQHRMLAKLKSTYCDLLLREVNPETGRVHTSYGLTGTATGRLSSSDPNLQNIPIRTEEGLRIRAAFIPEPGWSLISADYSQIELRVMAHLSGDEDFIAAFQRGEDIHYSTAKQILAHGGEPTPEMRRNAKAINFGILYGLSEFGLSKQLGIPRAEASNYIKAYFARYQGIRAFLDRTIEDAKSTGYVKTLMGRRRYLPDLHSKNGNVRQGAERIAMNTPIQGTAADIIKLAMLSVDKALIREKLRTRLLLQVHDELVLEAPEDEREQAMELVRREMSNVWKLAVPLEVDVGFGADWAAAH